jgi:predicted Zn-dependent protease with MMP-like domain
LEASRAGSTLPRVRTPEGSTSYDTLTEREWEQVHHIWDLLDEGDVDRARRELDALAAARPGHPDVRIVEAAVALDEGEAARALDALRGAERSADPALFFHLRAVAHYELVEWEDARDDAERAIAVHADLGEAHDLLSRVYEHLGDQERAGEHAELACEIDAEAFPEALEVADAEFDALVESSIKELPARVLEHLNELPVLVEPLPRRELLSAEKPPLSPDILGLFVGRHLMERSSGDVPGAPGVIYLFRRNLLRVCSDREELAREIRVTVQHEVGHLLGLDEDDLEAWGLG